MLHQYNHYLKNLAGPLRKNMTDSEGLLWSRIRRKQLLGIQFYRQRPIGKFIVDFYSPKANLVIEIDGSQHREDNHNEKDKLRDEYLTSVGLNVLRFNSSEVLKETDAVLEIIYRTIVKQLKSPSVPL